MMKNINSIQYALVLFIAFIPMYLFSNNIQVSNIILKNQNLAGQFTHVKFDLSWENSWRVSQGPSNWDAAWVFIKFRKHNQEWQHATLNYVNGNANTDGHNQVSGSTITTVPDGVGAFIYRDSDGTGHIDWQNIHLRWNYGVDGVGNNSIVEVKVFAVEMVYVPQGPFRLGGGNGSEATKFFEASGPINFSTPYPVTSEAEIPIGANPGSLYYVNPVNIDGGDQQGPVPAAFPKGYNAFYCMKYEVSQQQWIDFFNSLSPQQRINNDLTDLDHRGPNSIDRNTIQWENTGHATTENPNVPVTFPLLGEVSAYLDWSGLRPMTELEFVKACRGPAPAIPEVYAWGTTNMIDSDHNYDLLNKTLENEVLSNHVYGTGNANWWHSSIFEDGPYRCGIFAASTYATEPEDSGASIYGIMEMSGNVYEMAISIGVPEGRAFQAIHGDGVLTLAGEANVNSWPANSPDGVGSGLFGGSWFGPEEALWISDRRNAINGNIGYFNDVGFRGVRSAP